MNATRAHSADDSLRAENVRLRALLRQAGIEAASSDSRHGQELSDAAGVAERALSASQAETVAAQDLAAALSRAERRQAALVELGDRFRDIDSADGMVAVASEIIGRTLEASRAGYGTVDRTMQSVAIPADWCREGIASVVGNYRFVDFGSFIEDLKRGDSVLIDDVTVDPRTAGHGDELANINVRALLNVPVMEHGRIVAVLFVHDDKARQWSPEKLEFVRDVAQRTRDGVERRRAEEHERMLRDELQHRVKNTLSMVQAIASQTFRHTESVVARDAFSKRLISLAQANDTLSKAGWTAAQVRDVVVGATIPHCAPADRFTIDGPALEIAARSALALTLALHELCTNAAKYGALSNENGHVTIDWRVAPDATFRLRWAERGGPAVTAPTRTGFGSRLISLSLGPQVGGQVSTDYDASGVTCTFTAPMAAVQDVEGPAQRE